MKFEMTKTLFKEERKQMISLLEKYSKEEIEIITKLSWLKKRTGAFMKVGGGIMILMGVVLFFDKFSLVNSLLAPIFGDFQGF